MAVSLASPVVIALGTCPAHVRRLRAADLPAAERAVLASLPTLARRLDRRGAYVAGLRRTHASGDIAPARPCAAIGRSVLVHVVLPGERDASLIGNPTFYVARTDAGWVIWFQAH
jgi:hypothetical protein